MTPAVIVVGSLNVDLIVRVGRLPSPGETVIGGPFTRAPGGKGANQAAASARLGVATWMVGLVGDDDLGTAARADLEDFDVDVSRLGVGASHTGVAEIVVDDAGENLIAVASGANAELSPRYVTDALDGIEGSNVVVLANLEVPDDAVMAAGIAARRRGWRLVLNPAPARSVSRELLSLCHALTPNEREAEMLGPSLDELLAEGIEAIAVTRGAAGVDLYRRGAPVLHQPAFRVATVDTTGAGDAFSAGFACALAEGRGMEEAVRLGAAAGALATREVGARAAVPDRGELERFIADETRSP